jgi:hypothetical protein
MQKKEAGLDVSEIKNIKIAGFNVGVKTQERMAVEHNWLGEYSVMLQEIRIEESSTAQQKCETLIHEVLEAVNSIYDLNLMHDDQLCKLSVALHQIIVDNPKLVRYLGGGE